MVGDLWLNESTRRTAVVEPVGRQGENPLPSDFPSAMDVEWLDLVKQAVLGRQKRDQTAPVWDRAAGTMEPRVGTHHVRGVSPVDGIRLSAAATAPGNKLTLQLRDR